MNISKNKGAITLNNNLKPKEDKLTQELIQRRNETYTMELRYLT